jgi:glutamate synthase (NADPH/NADH) large chain
LIGAEEFGFATAPLVVSGCIMMRVCHLNTCPVGVATQDPALRKNFTGKAEHVVNFFQFIAQEVRELMAALGFKTLDEMIGRVDKLNFKPAVDHWKARGLDYSAILYNVPGGGPRRQTVLQDHGLTEALDNDLIKRSREALEHSAPVSITLPIRNVNRTTGTMLGYEVTKKYGAEGLPDDTKDFRISRRRRRSRRPRPTATFSGRITSSSRCSGTASKSSAPSIRACRRLRGISSSR